MNGRNEWLADISSGRVELPRLTLNPNFRDAVLFGPFQRSCYRRLEADVIFGEASITDPLSPGLPRSAGASKETVGSRLNFKPSVVIADVRPVLTGSEINDFDHRAPTRTFALISAMGGFGRSSCFR